MSRASVAVGADGLIIEVHNQPDKALSDGMQSLYPEQFDDLMTQVRQIAAVVGREIVKIDGATKTPGGVSAAPAPATVR
jgi:3-deoxy-7-phosphoheptulonate synthase